MFVRFVYLTKNLDTIISNYKKRPTAHVRGFLNQNPLENYNSDAYLEEVNNIFCKNTTIRYRLVTH